jgi:hypothetical protein
MGMIMGLDRSVPRHTSDWEDRSFAELYDEYFNQVNRW